MFGPNDRLISGIEPHEKDVGEHAEDRDGNVIEKEMWRVFVGPRALWKYVLVDFSLAQQVYHAFQGSSRMYAPLADDVEVYQVPREERDTSAEREKAMFYRVEELMKREAADVS